MPLLAEGEFALATQHLEAIGDKPDTFRSTVGGNDLYYMLTDLAVQQRDVEALRRHLEQAEEMAVRDGHKLCQASAQRAWGVLHRLTGDYTQAETHLRRAVELFQQLETRWQIGRTWSELAELSMAREDLTAAREYYSHALASYQEVRALPDITRTRGSLALIDK